MASRAIFRIDLGVYIGLARSIERSLQAGHFQYTAVLRCLGDAQRRACGCHR